MLVEPLCWSGGPSDGGAKPTIFISDGEEWYLTPLRGTLGDGSYAVETTVLERWPLGWRGKAYLFRRAGAGCWRCSHCGEGVVALNLVDRCQVLQVRLLPGVLGGHAVGQGGARHVESGAVEVEAYRVGGGVRGRLLSGGLGG